MCTVGKIFKIGITNITIRFVAMFSMAAEKTIRNRSNKKNLPLNIFMVVSNILKVASVYETLFSLLSKIMCSSQLF